MTTNSFEHGSNVALDLTESESATSVDTHSVVCGSSLVGSQPTPQSAAAVKGCCNQATVSLCVTCCVCKVSHLIHGIPTSLVPRFNCKCKACHSNESGCVVTVLQRYYPTYDQRKKRKQD